MKLYLFQSLHNNTLLKENAVLHVYCIRVYQFIPLLKFGIYLYHSNMNNTDLHNIFVTQDHIDVGGIVS